jgi:RNA polymerase II subunit A small phosphatase-like protein
MRVQLNVSRQLLILDIDETLLFASERPLSRPSDFRVGPYHVYKRPHVDRFLDVVAARFDLAVWTSSGEDYAAGALAPLFSDLTQLKFVWSRQRCTRRYDPDKQDEYWLKDLKKVARLGYSLERVLVIDDSPEKLQRHYGNHIRVSPFVGDPNDAELEQLIPFLEYMSTVENVRLTEKRGWRTFRGR